MAFWRTKKWSYMYRKYNSSIHDAIDVCNMFDSSDESDSSEESDSSGESDSSEESDSADKSKTGYKSNNPRNTYNVEDKKENGNVIQHIYNTGLDHDDWSEAMDTFLVCKINGVHNPKIIRNSENHAEQLLIRHLRKKYKEKKMALKLTVYINNSPCSMCAKALENFLNKNKNVKLTFYVTNMYHIKRNSCFKARHFEHLNSIPKKSHKANSEGLRDLLRHKRCNIKAFNMGVWKELLNTVDVLPKLKTKLIGGYNRIQYANKRSRGYEDDLIKKDLMYLKSYKK